MMQFLLQLLRLTALIAIKAHTTSAHNKFEVIYAINAGGEAHVDSNGIKYARDPLIGKIGTASDYGKQLMIQRVPAADQILYQTERYHHSTFGYEFPVRESGDYVVVLKFSEVYFNSPNMKVFDIVLNGEHTIVSGLDIYEKVGRGIAHDEYIPFKIQGDKLLHYDEESDIVDRRVKIDFIKGYRDNPKINAIVVIKGQLDDIPQLGPLPQESDDYGSDQEEEEEISTRSRHTSGPKTPDPYSMDDSSIMLPVFVAIGAFIPLLFCLCKL